VDISVAGHVSSGEEPVISALREIEEEIGLVSKKKI
jgi:8-oxo-dGTP pyrophosphatase MutT (NUDIX family)